MPHLLFFMPSESCSIDAGSNRISIFHVCEFLHLAQFPGLIPSIAFSALWQQMPNDDPEKEHVQTIRFIDPDGTTICRSSARFKMARKRHRLISIVSNVQIHRAGIHRAELHLHSPNEEPGEANRLQMFPIEVRQVQRREAPPQNN